jgi:4,5-dihydroxyphthalate decarboxylase
MPDPDLVLRTAIGSYEHTRALKDGTVRSGRLQLAHVEISPIHKAFRPMVNELAFDLSEMALVTYLLAKAFGRRLAGLPVVLMRNSPHAAIVCNARSEIQGPQDLGGRTIGVRAYTQTTGVWIRGILQEQFGVKLDTLRWITLEGAHVDGYREPSNVTRSDTGRSLVEMLLAGEIDAAVGIDTAGHPDLRPLIPDAERAEAEWSRRTGIYPINHVVVVKEEIAAAHPWVTGELFALFEAAKQRSPGRVDADRAAGRAGLSFGLEPNRAAIEALARYAFDQRITPRLFTARELFEAT